MVSAKEEGRIETSKKLRQLEFRGQRIPEENPPQRTLEMLRESPDVP